MKHIGHEYERIEIVAKVRKAGLSSLIKEAEDIKRSLREL